MKTAKRMTPAAFRAWMRRMGFRHKHTEAARELGCTRMSVRQWARTQGNGAPPHVALACEALERRREDSTWQ